MTDYTLLPDQLLLAVHNVCEVTGKEALATDYYRQAVMGGKQKIKHASLSVMRLWGVLDTVLVVVHYDTLREMKGLIVALDAHYRFRVQPTPWVYSVGLLSCWYRLVCPQHKTSHSPLAPGVWGPQDHITILHLLCVITVNLGIHAPLMQHIKWKHGPLTQNHFATSGAEKWSKHGSATSCSTLNGHMRLSKGQKIPTEIY